MAEPACLKGTKLSKWVLFFTSLTSLHLLYSILNYISFEQEFQEGKYQVILLTTGVGGVGLTLTRADRVILVNPAWNPGI